MNISHNCRNGGPCTCPPHPDLVRRHAFAPPNGGRPILGPAARIELGRLGSRTSSVPGLNDGAVIPPAKFPEGTPLRERRKVALERATSSGTIRTIVVLVQFPGQDMKDPDIKRRYFKDLFFTGNQGSVNDFYQEVSGGKVSFDGDVIGPFTLPRKQAEYANNNSGTSANEPNAQTMARDTLDAIRGIQNLDSYDSNSDGFVDSYVIVHAGSGAETDGDPHKIWSLQWTLRDPIMVGNVSVYAFLTIPDDALLGVTVHELGHLAFSWPDLYDYDGSSSGLGDWCLMSGGSWNGSPPGTKPSHPSAWCKLKQRWVTTVFDAENHHINLPDVKDGFEIHRLWGRGDPISAEYFLIENRQLMKYDAAIPGSGMLVYHVDDNATDNTDELHYKVGLMQADGRNDLATSQNSGDTGDPYPGSGNNVTFNDTSIPNSNSYEGNGSGVSVSCISESSPNMAMNIAVR